jgi:hypothetical protein
MEKNPMLQMLSNQLKPSSNPIANNGLLQLLQNSSNPRLFIQNVVNQNYPQVAGLINQYGNGNPQAAFYEYARVNGVDPDQFLSLLRNIK